MLLNRKEYHNSSNPIRLAVLQRVCTKYRADIFRRLSTIPGYRIRVFIGDDIPNSKVKSTQDFNGIDVIKLPTRFIHLGGRILVDHNGLYRALYDFHPDVILCEGESNILSYIKAMWYRFRNNQVGLVHWSLGDIPGKNTITKYVLSKIVYLLQRNFDTFVVYSSFGKAALVRLGHSSDKFFTAINVVDIERHRRYANKLNYSKSEARKMLGFPDKFTVLYVGAIDEDKGLDKLLIAARNLDQGLFNFVIVGDGSMIQELRQYIKKNKLKNVFFPGYVNLKLPLYYLASDVFVLPARGGIVISEAMAYSLPVIVFQADGTEYDLVIDGETGIHLDNGGPEEIVKAIKYLYLNPDKVVEWGEKGSFLVREKFTMDNMISQLIKAVRAAQQNRLKYCDGMALE